MIYIDYLFNGVKREKSLKMVNIVLILKIKISKNWMLSDDLRCHEWTMRDVTPLNKKFI